jgi:hypothetical protein
MKSSSLNTKKNEKKEEIFRDLGENIGNPATHHLYSMLREGNFSDYKLIWNEKVYTVYKVVLFSESLYFQALFSVQWEETGSRQLILPNNDFSNGAVEAFLAVLYTTKIRSADLKEHILELYFLSDYFQVRTLKDLVMKGITKCLTVENAHLFLPVIRTYHAHFLQEDLTSFIATNNNGLLISEFPFHKLGKDMLLRSYRNSVVCYRDLNPA